MIDEPSINPDTAELARLLREARAAKGWTLRQATGHTGISNGYLSLIEQGDVKSPSPRYLMVLAEKYELPFERLMALAGHPSGSGPSALSEAKAHHATSAAAMSRSLLRTAAPTRLASGGEPVASANDAARRGVDKSVPTDDALNQASAYAADLPASCREDLQKEARLPVDPGRADTPDAEERRQLTALVLDDMSALSTTDIAQVRAFIAGLRAARRS